MSRKSCVPSKSFLTSMLVAMAAAIPQSALAQEAEEVGVPSDLPGTGPFLLTTAEQPKLQAQIIARDLKHLYSITFLSDGNALVVERGRALRLIRDATGEFPRLEPKPIANTPQYLEAPGLHPFDVLGIQDVKPDKDFARNHVVYLTYNRPAGFDEKSKRITASSVLARARLEGSALRGMTDLIVGEPRVATGGSRILLGPEGHVFVSFGALSEGDIDSAQRLDNVYGKVLRVRTDGKVPADNPFVGNPGARPEIYTYGHRDPLGMASDPRSGRLVASEHGPQGGDELNELLAGRNYGWPTSTFGTEYGGSALRDVPVRAGSQAPLQIWSPAIAPAGIVFYSASAMPAWKGNLIVASARRGQINGTGGLVRVVFNDKLQEMRQEILLGDLHQRFKDVTQGPDGLLYAITDEENAVVLRICPG